MFVCSQNKGAQQNEDLKPCMIIGLPKYSLASCLLYEETVQNATWENEEAHS